MELFNHYDGIHDGFNLTTKSPIGFIITKRDAEKNETEVEIRYMIKYFVIVITLIAVALIVSLVVACLFYDFHPLERSNEDLVAGTIGAAFLTICLARSYYVKYRKFWLNITPDHIEISSGISNKKKLVTLPRDGSACAVYCSGLLRYGNGNKLYYVRIKSSKKSFNILTYEDESYANDVAYFITMLLKGRNSTVLDEEDNAKQLIDQSGIPNQADKLSKVMNFIF